MKQILQKSKPDKLPIELLGCWKSLEVDLLIGALESANIWRGCDVYEQNQGALIHAL